jgi:hypothetical protein
VSDLDTLIRELEESAARLRAGELDAAQAAELVERCAELAARVGTELDRAGREAERDAPAEGQEQLL